MFEFVFDFFMIHQLWFIIFESLRYPRFFRRNQNLWRYRSFLGHLYRVLTWVRRLGDVQYVHQMTLLHSQPDSISFQPVEQFLMVFLNILFYLAISFFQKFQIRKFLSKIIRFASRNERAKIRAHAKQAGSSWLMRSHEVIQGQTTFKNQIKLIILPFILDMVIISQLTKNQNL